jgi:tripartite-type tricarboxylate transporter receptor subunit TctC
MSITRRALLASPLLATAARAADGYPARPVRIIVPFPPGGALDALSRKVAMKLAEQIGQQFVIDNRTGATGTIGMGEASRAAPDGLTLLAVDSTYAMIPYVFKQLPWDYANGFQPISDSGRAASVLVVRKDASFATCRQLLDRAKQEPDKISYGSGGIGSVLHFATEAFQQAAGIRLFHVPYRGAGDAMIGLLSGQVDLALAPTPATIEHIRGGAMRALAVTGAQRASVLPEVPTLAECGVPGLEFVYWAGLSAPRGTPDAVIALLQAEMAKASQAPDMREFLAAQGAEPGGLSTADFSKLLREESGRWRDVAAIAKIEQQ